MIAGAFPGLFSYSALLNLDVRDWDFWAREAQKKTLLEKIEKIRMSRMAWVEGKDVQREIGIYQSELARLEGGTGKSPRANVDGAWALLKRKKRG